MKSKVKNIDKCGRLLEIEISEEIVRKATEEVYKEIKAQAKVPGFRVGAAPDDLLDKYYSKDAEERILKLLIPESYKRALDEHKVEPIALPEVSDIVFAKDKKLTFKAKVEVRPELKLKNYRSIKVKKQKVSVEEKEVEEALKRLREMKAQFTPVTEKRPVEKGDYVICDIEAYVDSKAISKKHENMWVAAEKDASMLGLGEYLVGANAGETKEINADLPAKYPDKKYAGKKADFKISVKEIKKKNLPALDDNFAKDLGKENLQALKEEVESQLKAKKEANAKIEMENQILDKLLKDYRFDVPSSIVKRQFEALLERARQELLSKGLQKDIIDKELKNYEPRLMEDAKNKVKIYFMLDEICHKEKINIGEDDIKKRLEGIARISGQGYDTVRAYYEKHDLMQGLGEELKEEAALNWLLSVADVEN